MFLWKINLFAAVPLWSKVTPVLNHDHLNDNLLKFNNFVTNSVSFRDKESFVGRNNSVKFVVFILNAHSLKNIVFYKEHRVQTLSFTATFIIFGFPAFSVLQVLPVLLLHSFSSVLAKKKKKEKLEKWHSCLNWVCWKQVKHGEQEGIWARTENQGGYVWGKFSSQETTLTMVTCLAIFWFYSE